jgi:transcriptional regulator with XRE-family HTH domain
VRLRGTKTLVGRACRGLRLKHDLDPAAIASALQISTSRWAAFERGYIGLAAEQLAAFGQLAACRAETLHRLAAVAGPTTAVRVLGTPTSDLGRRLRQLRRESHLTIQRVADYLKINDQRWASIEIGRLIPDARSLRRFAALIGVEPEPLEAMAAQAATGLRLKQLLRTMPRPSAPLARVLVALRVKRILSSDEAAAALGVSHAMWRRYERGESTPNTKILRGFAELVGCREAVLARARNADRERVVRLPRRWPRQPLARVLVALRVRARMTATAVARALGRKREYWYSVEQGQFRPPLDLLSGFASLVGCRPALLDRAYAASTTRPAAREGPPRVEASPLMTASPPTGGFWSLFDATLPVGHLDEVTRVALSRLVGEAYLRCVGGMPSAWQSEPETFEPVVASEREEEPIAKLRSVRAELMKSGSDLVNRETVLQSITEALSALGWREPGRRTVLHTFMTMDLQRSIRRLANLASMIDAGDDDPYDLRPGETALLVNPDALLTAIRHLCVVGQATIVAGTVLKGTPDREAEEDRARWINGLKERPPGDFFHTWRCHCGYFDGEPIGHKGRELPDHQKPRCPRCHSRLRYARVSNGEVQRALAEGGVPAPPLAP